MKTIFAMIFGGTLGFLGHCLNPFINTWGSATFARLFRYGVGMCLVTPTLVFVRHGVKVDAEAEKLIKDSVFSYIVVGFGVMVGYLIDQWRAIDSINT